MDDNIKDTGVRILVIIHYWQDQMTIQVDDSCLNYV